MTTFKHFLWLEADPIGGMGAPPMGGAAPLGAGGAGGLPGAGAMPPGPGGMGPPGMGDPMMGGGMGMGGAGAPIQKQTPVPIKDADIWTVLNHILNHKPMPKQDKQPQLFDQQPPGGGAPPMGDPMGGMGAAPPIDPMGGGAPPSPPMGGLMQ